MEGTYLFIDGGYYRETLRQRTQRVYGEVIRPPFDVVMNYARAEKLFYFDCQEAEPEEDEVEASPLAPAAVRQAVLNEQRCHYVEGYLTQGKKRKQKGVDVALAVFALDFALRNVIHKAILLAGDGDFLYLVDALVRHGTIAALWSDPKSVSQPLRERSDEFRTLDTCTVAQILSPGDMNRLGMPSGQNRSPVVDDWKVAEEWKAKTCSINIYEHEQEFHAFRHTGQGISHRNIEFVRAWIDDFH